MFKKAVPLDREKHKDLKFSPKAGYLFASDMSVSALSHNELVPAGKIYPIVFPPAADSQQRGLPLAVLSIENGKNAFVGEDGTWAADYIPMHFRRYPFILGRLPNSDKMAMMIDEAAPQFAEKDGQAMFTESGEPAELVEKAIKFLEGYQKDIADTGLLAQELEKNDLLKPIEFKITRGTAEKVVQGFRTVDLKKVTELDDATLAKWVKNGMLAMVYAHLFSLQNFSRLAKMQGLEATVDDHHPDKDGSSR